MSDGDDAATPSSSLSLESPTSAPIAVSDTDLADDAAPLGAPISGAVPPLHALFFHDSETGWAVGDGGTILATTDGGRTWQEQESGTEHPIYGIAFTSATNGWAVGEVIMDGSVMGGFMLLTTDGGLSWEPAGPEDLNPVTSVSFLDASTGVAGGWSGLAGGPSAYATDDGGSSWRPLLKTRNGMTATPVMMIDEVTWWTVSSEGMRVTTDGGATWRRVNSHQLNDVWFVDSDHGWGVGSDGVVATSDGGATWIPQDAGTDYGLTAVRFVDPLHGIAVGGSGSVIITSDGGTTWTASDSGTTASFDAVAYPDLMHAWAISGDPLGSGVIIASTDGGSTWVMQ